VDVPFSSDLALGIALHAGLEALLNGESSARALALVREHWLAELGSNTESADLRAISDLAQALLKGWSRAKLPAFLEQYEIVSVEKEEVVPLTPTLALYARADAVVRDRNDGFLYVINWKSTSSKKDWTQQWTNEVQAWTEALAIESALGEPVVGCIFEGFYKGGKYDDSSTSPLIRAFWNPETNEWSHERRGKPWIARSASQFPGGIAAWVDFLPLDVVEDQFVRSAPIIKDDAVVRAWLAQRIRFFTDAQRFLQPDVSEADRLEFFMQNFGWNCRGCPYTRACQQQISIEDLVAVGELKVRL
jgi:hypothetical protein